MSLGRLDLKAAFSWGVAEGVATLLASLLSVVVVARIVGPHAFGLASLTFLIVSLAELLVFVPFVEALIQRRRLTAAALDGAFAAMLLTSLAVVAGLCALGPLLARLLDAPELPWLLAVQASTCLLVAVRGAGEAHLARRLFFKALAVRNIVAKAASAGVSVGLALAGAGAWSLVLGNVAYGLAATVVVLATLRRRPRWRPDLGLTRSLLGAGAFHLADALLVMGAPRLFGVLVGLLHGVGAAGQAAFAFRIVDTVAGLVAGASVRVALPVLSGLAANPAAFAAAFARGTRLTFLVAAPAFAGLALAAPETAGALLGPGWDGTAAALAAAALFQLAAFARALTQPALKALGRPSRLLWLHGAAIAFVLPGALLAASFGFGATLAVWTASGLVHGLAGLILIRREAGIGWGAQLAPLAPGLLAAAAMALALAALDPALAGWPDPAALALKALAGALAYGAAALLHRGTRGAPAAAEARASEP